MDCEPLVDELNLQEIELVAEGAPQEVFFLEEVVRDGVGIEGCAWEAGRLHTHASMLDGEKSVIGHLRDDFRLLGRWPSALGDHLT